MTAPLALRHPHEYLCAGLFRWRFEAVGWVVVLEPPQPQMRKNPPQIVANPDVIDPSRTIFVFWSKLPFWVVLASLLHD